LGEGWVSVGRVGRPHGLKGEFVVERPSESSERFAVGARVYVGREPAEVIASKRSGGRLVVKLDRAAERGAELELPESELPPPEEGSYYEFQLVGLAVVDEDGRELGRVEEIQPGVANDVLRLDWGIALPLVEACVLDVDLEGGRMVIAPGFADGG
jgi:16S rRNA processing protein RimM